MNDIPDCEWLAQWQELAKRFAFQFNPALQPRAIIVYGCISKTTSDAEIKALLRILVKALESFSDIDLIDSIIMCLTRLLPLLSPESKIHKFMFWIAISILQLEETQLYASGLALLEQNLHTLDHMLNLFENTTTHQQQTLERIMMDAREPLEWQFKQLDASMGLSFKSNFNFALVGHLIKGFRHPVQSTVARTTRVLSALLSIVAKSESHDKFKVTPTSIPYLAALISVVEEVRTRCPVKHRPVIISSTANSNSTNILPLNYSSISTIHSLSHLPQSYSTTSIADLSGTSSSSPSYVLTNQTINSTLLNVQQSLYSRRQKSWDTSYIDRTRRIGGLLNVSGTRLLTVPSHVRHWHSFDIEHAVPRILTKPASTLVQLQQVKQVVPTISVTPQTTPETQQTPQISETNHLLDPNVLTDTSTQALVLTVLATLVRNTSDENEMRIIYEYLSESSIVFPKVFPVIHNLLDAKINSVLSLSHDESILASVQSIIYQMIACSAGDDASQQQQQLSYLQSCGFGGLWRFAGPFNVSRQNPDNVELFVNWLEAMVETCLPSLDEHEDGSESGVNNGNSLTGNNNTRHASLHHHRTFRHHHHYYTTSSTTACLNANLSSSMSSISIESIRSPTDRDGQFFDLNDLNRPAQSQSQNGNYTRSPNQLYQNLFSVRPSFSTHLLNTHQTSNILLSNVSFSYEDQSQCFDKSKSSHQTLSKITRQDKVINYLGFVLRSHSLFYCSVPKVATRTLLTFITYLHIRDDLIPLLTNYSTLNNTLNFTNNLNIFKLADFNQMLLSSTRNNSQSFTNNSISILKSFLSHLMIFNNTNLTKIDLWSMYQKESFPFIRLRTLSDPSILFSSNFTRVIFVRHPFERLASAYVDKIASLKHEPFSLYDNLRRVICRKYSSFYLTRIQKGFYRIHKRISNRTKEPCQKIIPKFEHFIHYLMSDSLKDDVHWQSYSKLCYVCLFKYNFIGKYETIKEDLQQLKLYLGLKSIHSNNENYFTTGKTKEYYKSLYSNLTNELICNLKYFYEDDFKLFNYRLEDYLTDQRTIQCSPSHKRVFKKRIKN
ncbi:unnamed protein product [Rotaria sordida]|uniref:Carbohydrate sulfotransferase n=1 Tax=Rotaria sordida TaxID=392033 RepID=A0A819V9E9_9BILA|nr:unnamed protein product [Rotaria sordida]